MKNFKKLLATVVLTLMLAISVFAGEISTTVTPPAPTSATTQGEISTTVTGQIETPVTSTDSATEIALNLLQSVLSLL